MENYKMGFIRRIDFSRVTLKLLKFIYLQREMQLNRKRYVHIIAQSTYKRTLMDNKKLYSNLRCL